MNSSDHDLGTPAVAGNNPVAVALADTWDSSVRDHLPSIVEKKREVSRALAYGIDVSSSISHSDVQDKSQTLSAATNIADRINSPERSTPTEQPDYTNIPLLTPDAILSGNLQASNSALLSNDDQMLEKEDEDAFRGESFLVNLVGE